MPTEHTMKDLSNTLRNLAAVAILLGVTAAATGAQAGVTGARTSGLKGYERHKPVDGAGSPGVPVAGNCLTNSLDRIVGGQRVWTQHGVITVGGHAEKVPPTECR